MVMDDDDTMPEADELDEYGIIGTPDMVLPEKKAEPAADIIEREKEIIVKAELPGVEEKDVKVDIKRNKVEIRAERSRHDMQAGEDTFRSEREYEGFYKKMTLPSDVVPGRARQDFRNGTLTLTLPKAGKRNR